MQETLEGVYTTTSQSFIAIGYTFAFICKDYKAYHAILSQT